MVSRNAAYAVSGIQAMLVTSALNSGQPKGISQSALKKVLTALWAVSFAWDAILAGDVADLREHLKMEGNARGIQFEGVW